MPIRKDKLLQVEIDHEMDSRLLIMAKKVDRKKASFIRWLINAEWDRFSLTEAGQQALDEERKPQGTE